MRLTLSIEKRSVSGGCGPGTGRALDRPMTPYDYDDIDERSSRFFCDVIAFVETVPLGARTSRIIEQLVDAAGSIETNRDEAAGRSPRECIKFSENSLRGANNSVQWLQACADRKIGSQDKCVRLLSDGRQLARMLSRIVMTAKRHGDDRRTRPRGDAGVAPRRLEGATPHSRRQSCARRRCRSEASRYARAHSRRQQQCDVRDRRRDV